MKTIGELLADNNGRCFLVTKTDNVISPIILEIKETFLSIVPGPNMVSTMKATTISPELGLTVELRFDNMTGRILDGLLTSSDGKSTADIHTVSGFFDNLGPNSFNITLEKPDGTICMFLVGPDNFTDNLESAVKIRKDMALKHGAMVSRRFIGRSLYKLIVPCYNLVMGGIYNLDWREDISGNQEISVRLSGVDRSEELIQGDDFINLVLNHFTELF